jgi:hypothetical protein
LTTAAWTGDALAVRDLAQSLLSSSLAALPCPKDLPPTQLVIAAALVELLAVRSGQAAPDWTAEIGPLAEPWFPVRAALSFPNLQAACLRESPEPLRKRRIFAPADYLTWA